MSANQKLTKVQFELAFRKYMKEQNPHTDCGLWEVNWEWARYNRGRSWCNEFFNTTEGAKYVANDR